MATSKLLWGTTWRGGAFGLLAGTLGGAAYGAVFANVLLLVGIGKEGPFVLAPQQVAGGVGAMLFFAWIGAVVGALFGVPVGLVVGIANGVLLGVVTRALFYPPRNIRTYRWTIAIVSAIFTGVAAWLCFIGIMLFYANRNAANVGVLIGIVTVPALIAGIGAGLMSRVIARWYTKLEVGN